MKNLLKNQMAYEIKTADEMQQMMKMPVCIVMFRLDGCMHCRRYRPTFEKLAAENPDVNAYVVENSVITRYLGMQPKYSFVEEIEGFPYTTVVRVGSNSVEVKGNVSEDETRKLFIGAKQAIGYMPARFAVSEEDAARFASKTLVRAREPHDKTSQDAMHKNCTIVLY